MLLFHKTLISRIIQSNQKYDTLISQTSKFMHTAILELLPNPKLSNEWSCTSMGLLFTHSLLPVPYRVLYYGVVYVFWSFSVVVEITNIVIFCSLHYQRMLIYNMNKMEMNSGAQC
jgi:hypothetical protein